MEYRREGCCRGQQKEVACGWWGHDGGGECSLRQIVESKLFGALRRDTLAHGAVTRPPELISRSKAKGLGQMINMLQLNGRRLSNERLGSWHSGTNRELACGWWRRLSGVVLSTDRQAAQRPRTARLLSVNTHDLLLQLLLVIVDRPLPFRCTLFRFFGFRLGATESTESTNFLINYVGYTHK